MSTTMTVHIAKAMTHGAYVGVTGDPSRLREMRSELLKQQRSQRSYAKKRRRSR
ncbi:hypothetical protein [Microbacterium sp. gxy059]|uniref:hypothetical protein n=1 Tax=Microbacterium sp. gxy059 TaxID=2957199 RepID=UPI003D97BB5B